MFVARRYNSHMAILDERTLDFFSTSPEQTERLGVRLGELLQLGDCVCLAGELGAGKTTLARGIGRGWGTASRITSPTFTLVNEYPRLRDGAILYHVDSYRLSGEADLVTAGLEDVLDDSGAVMIEWPERLESLLPENHLWVTLRYINDTRRGLRMIARGERALALLNAFKRSAFGLG
ncbi:MAG: tRNA (adenosine(37)-N6)-threonylcarbamoyltransferase complex ATPase subunit type 1 TsaE [Anaerolineae bacterium]|nr:tRNA (adenosine(37)-N6)-threonylcarbamoyltransferase complex ATPase subunit type 1 TsaE [Anaerolineae bacterium]